MEQQLATTITNRLLRDYEIKDKGEWLREGRCPECNKKSLYAHAQTPWIIKCGRENNCAWQATAKELYPDLFNHFSKRFPSSPTNPNAAADGYLTSRGFDIAQWRGQYRQEFYRDKDGQSTATVRFHLTETIYWERLIDNPERFEQKARFNYGASYKGLVWQPNDFALEKISQIWITEGIFDAMALNELGYPAVSAMSCNNYPEKFLFALRRRCLELKKPLPRLLFAFDNDHAGKSYTRKFVAKACEEGFLASARQLPQGREKDWNEAFLAGLFDEQDNYLKQCRYQGELLLAKTALEYAFIRYEYTEMQRFWFQFNQRTYWFEIDAEKYLTAMDAKGIAPFEAMRMSSRLTEITACAPRALYQQSNTVTDESWYYFQIDFPHSGKSVKSTFTAAQVTTPGEFKKRLAHVAPGAIWMGNPKQLDLIMKEQLYGIKSINTVDFVGYSREYQAWVFGDLAVQHGKLYRLNDEDYFDLNKLHLKTLQRSVSLEITPDDYEDNWQNTFFSTYGANGLVCLAFWFGSLFAEQVRAQYRMFPFLEMIGEAGAGKTTLVKFLWKLFGRFDFEGFDPNKATAAGRSRAFVQVAGLPVVLMEGDADMESKHRRFNWEDLKPLYNGNAMRSTGVRNAGNETYEPPFRGAIVIEQNQPVDASVAILSRIVQLFFSRRAQTDETYQLAKRLENWPMEKLSGFIIKACQAEKVVMQCLAEKIPEYEKRFNALGQLREFRIAQNHALIMALVDALGLVIDLSEGQKQAVWDLLSRAAIDRQIAINADHPLVQEFWEVFDYLNDGHEGALLDHSRDNGLIAINLNHFYELAERYNQRMPPITEMKHLLKSSKRFPYVEQTVVSSAISFSAVGAKSMRCWIFKRRPS